MPLYEYRCTRCSMITEVLSPSYDKRPSKTKCSLCSGDSYYKVSTPIYKDGDAPVKTDRPEQVFRGYPEVVVENAKRYKDKKRIERGEKRIFSF